MTVPDTSIRDMLGRTPGDWPTETQENGNYFINCSCGQKCFGPKRAYTCYPCHLKNEEYWNSLTPEQQKQHWIEAAAIAKRLLCNTKN